MYLFTFVILLYNNIFTVIYNTLYVFTSYLLKKSAALCLWRGKLSKLSVRTESWHRVLLFSRWFSDFKTVFIRGVLGVLIPIDGVFKDDILRGVGVLAIRSFWVANLLAAGDIVLKRSMVDLGDGLDKRR